MKSRIHNLDRSFFVAGVNYRTAPVEIRERMAVAHPNRIEVSRMLQLKAGLSEVVVLWSCNRVEIYGVAARDEEVDIAPMFACMARKAPSLASHVYCHRGQDALTHLFKVASGLDSMVLGETQITGQVRDAYEAAREAQLTGKILNSVFQKALRTAKAVRTQTSIGRGARSVGGVAVARAMAALGSRGLNQHSVLMIGVEAMAKADVVISSTGSPDTIIARHDLEGIMPARADRPLVIIDIAVPRDVEPGVADIDGVFLHDIDALESTVQQTLGRWEKDLEVCGNIIGQEIENLMVQMKNRRAAENVYHDGATELAV